MIIRGTLVLSVAGQYHWSLYDRPGRSERDDTVGKRWQHHSDRVDEWYSSQQGKVSSLCIFLILKLNSYLGPRMSGIQHLESGRLAARPEFGRRMGPVRHSSEHNIARIHRDGNGGGAI